MERQRAKYINVWRHRTPGIINNCVAMATASNGVVCLSELTHLVNAHDSPVVMYGSHDEAEPPVYLTGLRQLQSVLGSNFLVRFATTYFTTQTCARGQEYKGVGIGGALVHHRALPVVGYGHCVIELRSRAVSDPILQWIVYEKKFVRYLVAHLCQTSFADNVVEDGYLRNCLVRMVRGRLADVRAVFNVQRTIFGGDLGVGSNAVALRILEEPASDGVRMVDQVRWRQIRSTSTKLYQQFGRRGYEQAGRVFTSAEVRVEALRVERLFAGSPHAPLEVLYF